MLDVIFHITRAEAVRGCVHALPHCPAYKDAGGAVCGESPRGPPRMPTSRGTVRSRATTWGAWGGVAAEATVKGCVMESLLQKCPLQQEPWSSMFVQGLVVPMTVQEGRWQVLMYTGTEKLPGGSEERSELREAAAPQRPGLSLGPQINFQSPSMDWGHVISPCLLPQTRAMPPSFKPGPGLPVRPAWSLYPQASSAYTPLAQALLPSQPLTNGHLAIALEADALVLVTMDPPGLLRGAVLGVDPHAGVALDAAERRWVRRWRESIGSHSGNASQVQLCGLCTAPGRPTSVTRGLES